MKGLVLIVAVLVLQPALTVSAGGGSVCVAAGTDAARTRPLADRSASRMVEVNTGCVMHSKQTASQPADNPWAFEEEDEPVETWRQLVTDQAADIGLFVAFAALALTSFFRKSVPLKNVTLVAAVAYLGVY